ncbi:MAG: Ig-like domain-containing protein [Lachnospiraceae bacterium]|nr:Ig-like domain-containing protein [Lachnospiraceae bacterium]
MPTESPKVASTIGLKNVVIAELLTDTESGHTYSDPQAVAGAIEATIAPNNTDADIQYADDIEFDTLYPDPEITFRLQMADIPLLIQKKLFDQRIDNNGVLIRSAGDKPKYFAVGFKSEKSDGNYRFVWLYKCRATPMTENYGTKQGPTINRQTGEVEFTSVKRTHDGRYQVVADEDENDFAGEATFLSAVYEPTVTARIACTGLTSTDNSLSFTSLSLDIQWRITKAPANSTDVIRYGTSNGSIATVSNTGMVHPVANGTCTVVAVCGDYTVSIPVTVNAT